VEEAVLSGARLISGGLKCTDDSGKGNFFEPTLLADCDNGMTVFLEESFGPIVAIGRVKDDNEAVNLINDSKYGLTAGIYTSDLPFAK
jgi:acyl-CoA reductase-like NAD-dependent aldehyde dehydrogenase